MTKTANPEIVAAATVSAVKAPSRYEVHYARLRELQAERKAFKEMIDQKIKAAQQEYKDYLVKYEAARKESEDRFHAAAKPKAVAQVEKEVEVEVEEQA